MNQGRSALAACAAVLLATTAAAADVTVARAWARATPPGADSATLYLTLHSTAADRLVAIETAAAGMAMLHESTEQEGVSRMRDIDAIDLPAGRDVVLRPGGQHVMLMGLAHPLAPGQHFAVTLTFAIAPPATVEIVVAPLGAVSPP